MLGAPFKVHSEVVCLLDAVIEFKAVWEVAWLC